jgi:hypothetical protein
MGKGSASRTGFGNQSPRAIGTEDAADNDAPAALPLMPNQGRDFLEGTVNPDKYLRTRRREAREKAILEVERSSHERTAFPIISLTVFIVTTNVVVSIASFLHRDELAGFAALLMGLVTALIGLAVVGAGLGQRHRTRS